MLVISDTSAVEMGNWPAVMAKAVGSGGWGVETVWRSVELETAVRRMHRAD